MKLVHCNYPITVVFEENTVNVLSVEQPKAFTEIIKDFITQSEGGEGNFILSENIDEIKFDKKVDFILSPLSAEINQKKVLNKISSILNKAAQTDMTLETAQLNSTIQNYLNMLSDYSPFDIEFCDETDIVGLLKLYDIHIPVSGMTVAERLLSYMKAMNKVCGIEVFAVLNLKQYMTKEELEQFYECVFYEKVNLLIIEGIFSGKEKYEKCLIYDKDYCIIEP